MIHIALYQPEIPPNTGNILRLCANTGAVLHLIQPLGFRLDERSLRRAGLDYAEIADLRQHASLEALRAASPERRLIAFTTRGRHSHADFAYQVTDILLFGPETRGLPSLVLDGIPADRQLRLPMRPGARSLNLSNAVAVAAYEAWRQLDFCGSSPL